MNLNEFRAQKQQMTVQQMVDQSIALEMLVDYTDHNNQPLSDAHAQRLFLVYPGELVIEVDQFTKSSHPLKYHLRIHNEEMIGGSDRLDEMEHALHDFGLSEGRIG